MPGGRGFPSDPACLTSSVLRYLGFAPALGPVLSNIAAQYSRPAPNLRAAGRGKVAGLPHTLGWASKSVSYFGDVQ